MTEKPRWADEDQDDDFEFDEKQAFETKPDKDGIKTVTYYTTNDKNQSVKIEKRVREVRVKTKINKAVLTRQAFFSNIARDETTTAAAVHDEVAIEIPKSTNAVREDRDEDYYFHDLPKKDNNMFARIRKQKEEERKAEEAAGIEEKKEEKPEGTEKKKYVPPQHRVGARAAIAGADKENDWTIKVSNLTDDCEQEDLQVLFKNIAQPIRIFVAKKQMQRQQGNRSGGSKGFAFVTFKCQEDGQKAIDKLNRYGYDNLILQVEWANRKPK